MLLFLTESSPLLTNYNLNKTIMMGYYGYGPHWGSFGVFGLVFGIFIWIVVIVLIIAIIRRVVWGSHWRRHNRGMHGVGMEHNDTAMEILSQRFAKGEINKEEYEERKKVLMS